MSAEDMAGAEAGKRPAKTTDEPVGSKVVKLRQPPPPDWRAELAYRGDRIIPDERNVLQAFRTAPDLIDLVRFNEFQNRVEFGRPPPWRHVHLGDPWSDPDDLHSQSYLQEQGLELRQRGSIAECVAAVARDWTVHPVRTYLASLKWDGVSRLQLWLAEYLNAEGPPDYLAAVGIKFLISAVARIQRPGCQVDHTLVLEGAQGIKKTETVRTLGAPWVTDGLPDLHSKDAAIHLAGVWFVEIAELAAMRRSEIESTKAFLSRREDRYRPPYARRSVDVPRQCVFVATTNEATYLRDPTGNRRFWPVRCGPTIDLDGLARDRDQLWAEAVHRYEQGEAWHPSEAEARLATAEQHQRVLVTELEQQVAAYLERKADEGMTEMSTSQVFIDALGIDPSADVERAGRLARQVSEAMHMAGWRRIGRVGRGRERRTVYRLPDRLTS
jgi:predicted P-loop ATPase